MKKKPIPPNNLWEKLEAARDKLQQKCPEPREPGTFTLAEYAEKTGLSFPGTYALLKRMKRAGIVECARVWIRDVNGNWKRISGYRIRA